MSSLDASIVLVSYNRPTQLARSLYTVAHQRTKCRYEVIAVDDGYMGNQLLALWEARQKYPRLRLTAVQMQSARYGQYGGQGIPRNVGMRYAQGRILIMFAGDLLMPSNFVQDIVAYHDASPVDLYLGVVLYWLKPDYDEAAFAPDFLERVDKLPWRRPEQLLENSDNFRPQYRDTWNALKGQVAASPRWEGALLVDGTSVKLERMKEIGGWDEDLTGFFWEDEDLRYRFPLIGVPLAMHPTQYCIHQPHSRELGGGDNRAGVLARQSLPHRNPAGWGQAPHIVLCRWDMMRRG